MQEFVNPIFVLGTFTFSVQVYCLHSVTIFFIDKVKLVFFFRIFNEESLFKLEVDNILADEILLDGTLEIISNFLRYLNCSS